MYHIPISIFQIQRSGKRKKTSAPKTGSKKENSPKKHKKPADNQTENGSISIPEEDSKQNVCSRSPSNKKLSFSEKKEKVKMKRKEKMQQVKLKRLKNPDSEENKLRLEKLKAKRKAKKLRRQQEKQLKSELDKFISEKQDEPVTLENTGCPTAPINKSEEELDVTSRQTVATGSPVFPSDDDDEEKVNVLEQSVSSETSSHEITSVDVVDSALDDIEPLQEPVSESVTLSPEEKERGRVWLNLDVCEPIVKGLLELGFVDPTPIQQACIPAGLLKYKVGSAGR